VPAKPIGLDGKTVEATAADGTHGKPAAVAASQDASVETAAVAKKGSANGAHKGKHGGKGKPGMGGDTPPPHATVPKGPFLKDIDLKIKRGAFVMVCGMVGSGKSALLGAMLNEMNVVKGSVVVNGRVALAPQSAWITNNSLRGACACEMCMVDVCARAENVTFSRPFDEKKCTPSVCRDLRSLTRAHNCQITPCWLQQASIPTSSCCRPATRPKSARRASISAVVRSSEVR
jgi:hypothetical protein